MRDGRLHVLTLTPFYPTETDNAQGCFVAEPLRSVEALDVKQTVLVAQPFYREEFRPNKLPPPAVATRYFSLPGGAGLPTSGLFLFARMLTRIKRIHGADPIHLVHAHSALPCGHAAALLSRELRIPFVVTVHGLDAYSTRQVKGISGEWCRRISRFVFRSACRTICVSEKVAEQVVAGATTPMRTVVVYNGVDTELFSPAKGSGGAMRILSVGGLIPIKGHELLLRAFAVVRDRFPDCSCEIVGEGAERRRLEKLADTLGIAGEVFFRGRLARGEVADAMRECTLFALPSRYEALGCVYLEAMASGKVAIGCRGQGIDEVIRHGENGWLVDPGDVDQLADGMKTLLEDEARRCRIGKAARETVRAGYTLAQQALSLRQVYEECAE